MKLRREVWIPESRWLRWHPEITASLVGLAAGMIAILCGAGDLSIVIDLAVGLPVFRWLRGRRLKRLASLQSPLKPFQLYP